MKISIRENDNTQEIEVIIRCNKINDQVNELLSLLTIHDKKLTGEKDGKTYLLSVDDILYIESVDKKTFAYTKTDAFELGLRLYELESRLPRDFFRASKASIINISKIKSITPDFNGRLAIALVSGEKLIVSRQYAQNLKSKLEL